MIKYSHRLPIDAFDGVGAFFSCNSLPVPGEAEKQRQRRERSQKSRILSLLPSNIPESLWSQNLLRATGSHNDLVAPEIASDELDVQKSADEGMIRFNCASVVIFSDDEMRLMSR
jgi:hypothetical protein